MPIDFASCGNWQDAEPGEYVYADELQVGFCRDGETDDPATVVLSMLVVPPDGGPHLYVMFPITTEYAYKLAGRLNAAANKVLLGEVPEDVG